MLISLVRANNLRGGLHLSYYWEPQWVRKVFVFNGVEIETCQDLVSGLIVCPICVDIDKLCPSRDRPSNVLPPENATFFFSLEDLYRHLYAHRESAWRTALEVEEGEEGEAGEEGEEEGEE